MLLPHCFPAWPTVVMMSLGATICNNLNTFLISMDLTDYITSLPYVSVMSGIVGKIIIGFISDKVYRIPICHSEDHIDRSMLLVRHLWGIIS